MPKRSQQVEAEALKTDSRQILIVDGAPLTEEVLQHRRVAVATVDGRSYYNIIKALKLMDIQFDSISPAEAAESNARVIITTRNEAGMVNKRVMTFLDTELEKYPAISKARILRTIAGPDADDQLIIGIDPGSRIGISVIYLNQEISSIVESSVHDAVEQVSALLGGITSKNRIVRIGDGGIRMTAEIAKMLKARFRDSVRIEIVNEHGTSRNADANRRGARDRSSARTIAFRTGRSFSLR